MLCRSSALMLSVQGKRVASLYALVLFSLGGGRWGAVGAAFLGVHQCRSERQAYVVFHVSCPSVCVQVQGRIECDVSPVPHADCNTSREELVCVCAYACLCMYMSVRCGMVQCSILQSICHWSALHVLGGMRMPCPVCPTCCRFGNCWW